MTISQTISFGRSSSLSRCFYTNTQTKTDLVTEFKCALRQLETYPLFTTSLDNYYLLNIPPTHMVCPRPISQKLFQQPEKLWLRHGSISSSPPPLLPRHSLHQDQQMLRQHTQTKTATMNTLVDLLRVFHSGLRFILFKMKKS